MLRATQPNELYIYFFLCIYIYIYSYIYIEREIFIYIYIYKYSFIHSVVNNLMAPTCEHPEASLRTLRAQRIAPPQGLP